MTRESAIKRTLLQFVAASTIVLLVVVREEVVGALSPRGMAIVALFLWVGGFTFMTLRFRAINHDFKLADQSPLDSSDPGTRKKIMRSIRILRVGLVMMPVFLIYGLSATSGGPLFPRITGAAINLLITWTIYRALRVERAKLQQAGSNTMQPLSSAPKP